MRERAAGNGGPHEDSMMRQVCAVDASALLPLLPALLWMRSGTSPWDGAYGMIGWSHMPEPVRAAVEEIAGQVLGHLPGRRRGTTFLAKLVPGQRHPLHTDREDDGCDFRVHVPLVTNPAAVFIEDGESFHMAPGWAYRVDPTRPHTAFNGGETDRIHLLFNAVTTGGIEQ